MCGRYSLTSPTSLTTRFSLPHDFDLLPPRYNISPGSSVPTIIDQDGRLGRMMTWGFVPSWSPDPQIGPSFINARLETVDHKPTFTQAFRTGRCLIPADGFFEWHSRPSPKQPFYFHLPDHRLFAFAGLYNIRHTSPGLPKYSCAILTRPADQVVASIHPRMPVILSPSNESVWLDPRIAPDQLLAKINLSPSPALFKYPVSPKVNSPSRNTSDIIDPIT